MESGPWSEVIVLENEDLRVEVIPTRGAKIASLCSKRSPAVEWLWTNPGLALEQVDTEGLFDDNFYGGIDELFPNDSATCVAGMQLPDHGEFWRRAWSVEVVTPISVSLSVALDCLPVRATRRISLAGASLVSHTLIENLSDVEIPFLWVSHPAFRIDESCQLYIPPGSTVLQDEQNGRVPQGTRPFRWPGTDLGLDLNRIPPVQDTFESYYVLDVPEGRFSGDTTP